MKKTVSIFILLSALILGGCSFPADPYKRIRPKELEKEKARLYSELYEPIKIKKQFLGLETEETEEMRKRQVGLYEGIEIDKHTFSQKTGLCDKQFTEEYNVLNEFIVKMQLESRTAETKRDVEKTSRKIKKSLQENRKELCKNIETTVHPANLEPRT